MKSLTLTIYTTAIGLSAFLLFLVQPMMAKLLLPLFGGGASIWITSLVFFQVMLLLGYAVTHWLIKTFGLRKHMLFAAALLVCSLLVLPLGISTQSFTLELPAYRLLLLLLFSVGLPYLMLSTTSPTLQYWMANDLRVAGVNPYIQYGVSNVGSLLGLLIYPFIVEPYLDNTQQTRVWTWFYGVYGIVVALALTQYLSANKMAVAIPRTFGQVKPIWFLQALVPSALLMVITHYLTLDVVNLPLLWIAPLALYLLTFVICFLFPGVSKPGQIRTMLGVLSLLLLMLTSRPEMGFGIGFRMGSALLALFLVCMVMHGDLERGKPNKQDLTGFYLIVASGGAAGSVLVGLIAPLLFQSTFEFPVVVLAGLCYLVAGSAFRQPMRRALFVLFAVVFAAAYVSHETSFDGQTVERTRSFYGTYAIRDVDGIRRLVAGTHVHGEQFLDPEREHVPIAYYHEDTGVARLFTLTRVKRIALIGLGIGSLVEYGTAEMQFDVFELDPEVVNLARNYFSVLSGSPARLAFYTGDGRIQLHQADGLYDLIVMDAFTSGSIPTHLVTLEALRESFGQLAPGGVIAYHISNHYLDLLPVLNAIAFELNVDIRLHQSTGDDDLHKYPARWVILTENSQLTELLDAEGTWQIPDTERILWRDDASDIQSVLKFMN